MIKQAGKGGIGKGEKEGREKEEAEEKKESVKRMGMIEGGVGMDLEGLIEELEGLRKENENLKRSLKDFEKEFENRETWDAEDFFLEGVVKFVEGFFGRLLIEKEGLIYVIGLEGEGEEGRIERIEVEGGELRGLKIVGYYCGIGLDLKVFGGNVKGSRVREGDILGHLLKDGINLKVVGEEKVEGYVDESVYGVRFFCRGVLLRGKGGEVIGGVGVGERLDTKEELRRSLKDLLEKMRVLERSISSETLEDLKVGLRQISELIEDLKKHEKLMNKSLTKIGGISDRAKVLSFNAAIESSRAGGSHGKGFGVVSEEIRKLSESIKAWIGSSNKVLEEVRDQVKELRGIDQKTLGLLGRINDEERYHYDSIKEVQDLLWKLMERLKIKKDD